MITSDNISPSALASITHPPLDSAVVYQPPHSKPPLLPQFLLFTPVACAGYQPVLQDMYANWPFFTSTLDLVEMVLAKADSRLSAFYERMLVDPALAPLGQKLRAL